MHTYTVVSYGERNTKKIDNMDYLHFGRLDEVDKKKHAGITKDMILYKINLNRDQCKLACPW